MLGLGISCLSSVSATFDPELTVASPLFTQLHLLLPSPALANVDEMILLHALPTS